MKRKNSVESLKPLAILTTVGMNMVIYPFVMLFIGTKLNEYFGTGDLLSIVLMLLGFIAGFRMMFRTIKGVTNE